MGGASRSLWNVWDVLCQLTEAGRVLKPVALRCQMRRWRDDLDLIALLACVAFVAMAIEQLGELWVRIAEDQCGGFGGIETMENLCGHWHGCAQE